MLRLAGIVLLALPLSCERKGVLLWKACGRGATVYLLGSIPTKEAEPAAMDPRIEAAFASSDALVLESRVDIGAAKETEGALSKAILLPPGDTLHGHLYPELKTKLAARLASEGGSIEGAQAVRPWALAVILAQEARKRLGYPAARPIDRYFADAGGKPVSYLQTPPEALSTLTGLSESAETECLAEALESSEKYEKSFPKAFRAWRRGDDAAFLAWHLESSRKYPRCESEFRGARLKLFMARISPLFEEPKTTFVVVLATDLVGDDGIPARLRAQGIDVVKL